MCSASWSAALQPAHCGTMLTCRSIISTAARCTGINWAKAKAPEAVGRLMMRFAKPLFASAALFLSLAGPARAELDVAWLKKTIEMSIASQYPKLDVMYKDIHAHPELAFLEEKTAARLAAEMHALGF